MTREEKVAELRRLRGLGLTVAQAGVRVGLTESGAANLLNDPDGAKQRARRERYRGRCEVCGSPTDGSGGFNAPRLCAAHKAERQHEERHWTRERIIDAFQQFARVNGRPPSVVDTQASAPTLRRVLSPERVAEAEQACSRAPLPNVSTVGREFGGWRDALRAAGLPVNHRGRNRGARRRVAA